MPDSEPPRLGNEAMAMAASSAASTSSATVVKSMVKYGELVILGYNGQLPQGIQQCHG